MRGRGKVICVWCGKELVFEKDKGYVHPGGGIYIQICKECGWRESNSPPLLECPECGSENIIDDHCSMPWYVSSKEEEK